MSTATRKSALLDLCIFTAAAAYLVWNARDLANAWLHSPYDRWGWIAAAIWIVPVIYQLLRGLHTVSELWLWTGLAFALAGNIVDLNILRHLGLAIACAGIPAGGSRRVPFIFWLLCAVSWMPAFGWALKGFGPVMANTLRILLSITSVVVIQSRKK